MYGTAMEHSLPYILKRFVVFILFIGLLVLSYRIIMICFVPLAWAAIIGYVTWPAYKRLRHRWPEREI